MWTDQHGGELGRLWEAEGKRRDGGWPEEGRMQDERQIHGCDLDQIDLSVCNGRAVKHGLKTRTQPTASFTPVVFAHHNVWYVKILALWNV